MKPIKMEVNKNTLLVLNRYIIYGIEIDFIVDQMDCTFSQYLKAVDSTCKDLDIHKNIPPGLIAYIDMRTCKGVPDAIFTDVYGNKIAYYKL